MYALKEKLERRTNRYKPDRRKLKKVADFGYIEIKMIFPYRK